MFIQSTYFATHLDWFSWDFRTQSGGSAGGEVMTTCPRKMMEAKQQQQ